MTSKITLSNRKYSQNVLMSKSTNKSRICTVNMDLYLVNESFMFDFQTLGYAKQDFPYTLNTTQKSKAGIIKLTKERISCC